MLLKNFPLYGSSENSQTLACHSVISQSFVTMRLHGLSDTSCHQQLKPCIRLHSDTLSSRPHPIMLKFSKSPIMLNNGLEYMPNKFITFNGIDSLLCIHATDYTIKMFYQVIVLFGYIDLLQI